MLIVCFVFEQLSKFVSIRTCVWRLIPEDCLTLWMRLWIERTSCTSSFVPRWRPLHAQCQTLLHCYPGIFTLPNTTRYVTRHPNIYFGKNRTRFFLNFYKNQNIDIISKCQQMKLVAQLVEPRLVKSKPLLVSVGSSHGSGSCFFFMFLTISPIACT